MYRHRSRPNTRTSLARRICHVNMRCYKQLVIEMKMLVLRD